MKNNTILIIDDEEVVRELITDTLEDFEYELISATNGQEGLEVFEKHGPVLVILDLKMPVMEGVECLKRLKLSPNSSFSVIVLSGHGDNEDIKVCFHLGVSAFQRKPFNVYEFKGLVKHTISLKNLQIYFEECVEERTAELKRAREIAEEACLTKSIFLNNVTHELRTPLTSLRGFITVMKERFEKLFIPAIKSDDKKMSRAIEFTREEFEIMEGEGVRLTTLINDVLDLAKIESGKVEWKEEEVDMTEVFKRASAVTSSLLNSKGLELRSEIEGEGFKLTGDRDKLIQVVVNLFSNSVKFTEKGNITYKISGEGDKIRCEVKDTGIGIPEHMLEKIFEQFQQAEGDLQTGKPGGTGLGLAICRHIIEHHGGKIWAESEPGKGSRFIFLISRGRVF